MYSPKPTMFSDATLKYAIPLVKFFSTNQFWFLETTVVCQSPWAPFSVNLTWWRNITELPSNAGFHVIFIEWRVTKYARRLYGGNGGTKIKNSKIRLHTNLDRKLYKKMIQRVDMPTLQPLIMSKSINNKSACSNKFQTIWHIWNSLKAIAKCLVSFYFV